MIAKIIQKRIAEELADCKRWYTAYFKEKNIPIKTLADTEEALHNIEPQDENENVIFSAGFIEGLQTARYLTE